MDVIFGTVTVLVFGGMVVCFVLWIVHLYRRPAPPEEERPRCRRCGYDLRATPHRCPECGWIVGPDPSDGLDVKKLRDDWPENPTDLHEPPPSGELTCLLVTRNPMLVGLLMEQLRSRGVPCSSTENSELRGDMGGFYNATMILVAKTNLEAAMSILERFRYQPDPNDPSNHRAGA